ncbi:M14 family metallopeptidase [uncultured Piscinibacter sp.]|uniref:M14 family metallopeptidase n=1 Tax=uncultured Piscinibacter sp. TaxID=1131835 RepID=UPI00261616CE|nr:M14 family metallopeptidase [uncultured Piscinibacter sp.]
MNATAHFAGSYAQARQMFLAAADAAGLDAESHAHPLLGRDGEVLAMDVALEGAKGARSLLVVSSGCHGIEGFCGSGVQHALLSDADWHRLVHESSVAVLYLHALNPHGFSWWRRTTQENVDLNRNFHDFSQPLPANPAYDEIAALIVPPVWPPSAEAAAALERWIARHGPRAFQQAVTSGQHDHPEGLFYGGRNPTWSNVTLRHVLQEHARRCERLGWIDLHTGLGPSGVGERIFACRDDADALARARAWWGPGITSIYDGSSASARLTGMMWMSAYEECPQAEYTGIALEYGTEPLTAVLDALRADQWLENHPEAPEAQRQAIKRRMQEAFYTDTAAWKDAVLTQAFAAARQAVAGLAG